MREIALEFTDQEKHLKAAEEFRLPYWDYYRPRGYEAVFPGVVDERKSTSYPFDFGAPQIFMLEKVLLRLPPHGDAKFEYNPLRTFWFPPKALSEDEWDSMEMRVSVLANTQVFKLNLYLEGEILERPHSAPLVDWLQ